MSSYQRNLDKGQPGGIFTRIRHAVGVLALAVTTLFLEFYLRLLGHLQPSSRRRPVDDEVDANANYRRGRPRRPVTWSIWVASIFSTENGLHICRFYQRFITLQSAIVVTLHLWPIELYKQILFLTGLLLVPRLLFSIIFIMKKHNYREISHQPTNPDRHVNLTLMLLHYTYKGIRHIYKVLSGIEQIIIYVCQTIEFVFIQLLGYTYENTVIRVYFELESFIVISLLAYFKISYFNCLDIFFSTSKAICVLPTEIVLMISLYFIRFLLRTRSRYNRSRAR